MSDRFLIVFKFIFKFFKLNIFFTNIIMYLGYEISKSKRKYKKIEFDKTIKFFLNDIPESKKTNNVIFDVGAHEGQSIIRFKNLLNDPIVHSFEPQKIIYSKLQKNFQASKNVILNNLGLSDKKENRKFYHVQHNSSKSSFYQIKKDLDNLKNSNKFIDDDFLNLSTLDSYVEKNNITRIHLLKIDTQGFENKVLKGAKEALQKNIIDMIELEIQLGKIYDHVSSFNEIENEIFPYGYKLIGLYHDIYKNDNITIIGNPTLEYEALYVKKEFFDNYQPEIVKLDNGTRGLRFVYYHDKQKVIYNS